MLEAMIGISVGVNRLLEGVKRFTGISPEVTYLLSLVFSVAGAFAFSVNMFADLPNVPPLIGIFVTGLVIGGGSNSIHAASDIKAWLTDRLRPIEIEMEPME